MKVKAKEAVLASVIMPCLNEEKFIRKAIESLIDDYFLDHGELIVADGNSDDRTKEIAAQFIAEGVRVRLLDNKTRTQASGLNLGIREAQGEYIVRADAHCVYPPGYVKRCVELLKMTGAGSVGGRMLPKGTNDHQQAIALAFQHPVGAGDAKWRLGNFQGDVDTVYLGTFRRDLFDEIGFFDQNCRTNEDCELEIRILKAGKRVYLDSSIQVIYFPREAFQKLVSQYFFYGKGRAYTTFKHKRITSWRQLMPQLIVLGLFTAFALSIWNPLFLLIPGGYLAVLLAVAFLCWRKGRGPDPGSGGRITGKHRLLMAVAWALMHVSWGAGFFSYCLRGPRPPKKKAKAVRERGHHD